MPPKAKFTRDEIIDAAFSLTKADGPEALTARALGAKLGSSSRPIFTIFENMEQVQQEVILAAKKLYGEYINRGLNRTDIPAFKGVGMGYIEFSLAEPKLFQALFMSRQSERPTLNNILPIIDDNYPRILDSIRDCFDLNQRDSQWLYQHLWIYSHGIAVLCATNMCTFSINSIDKMLTEICTSLLKAGRKNNMEEKND